MPDRPIYSIVVPIHNEEEVLPELERRLVQLMARLDGPTEVVLVDDGSRDTSLSMMNGIAERDERFCVVELSRNFGHQTAITAGMDYAHGDAVVVMDADLQDPPELVLEMAARWREGFEVVYAIREDRREDARFRRMKALFYRGLNRISDVNIPADVGDFRLLDRTVVDALGQMRERNRYVRGMCSWVGFRQVGVPYVRPSRHAGTTKYSLGKLVRLAINGIVSSSTAPLRFALGIGLAMSAVAILGAAAALAVRLTDGGQVPGWASIAIAICLIGGIQLFILGVMGEYIGRISEEVKNRPLYFVRDPSNDVRTERAVDPPANNE